MLQGEDDEYAELLAEHRELERDHQSLTKQRPVDVAAHRRHMARLRDHSNRLHRYIEQPFKAGVGVAPRAEQPKD